MRMDLDCYKEFKIGSSQHKRYSQKAIEKIAKALEVESADDIWTKRQESRKVKLSTAIEANSGVQVISIA